MMKSINIMKPMLYKVMVVNYFVFVNYLVWLPLAAHGASSGSEARGDPHEETTSEFELVWDDQKAPRSSLRGATPAVKEKDSDSPENVLKENIRLGTLSCSCGTCEQMKVVIFKGAVMPLMQDHAPCSRTVTVPRIIARDSDEFAQEYILGAEMIKATESSELYRATTRTALRGVQPQEYDVEICDKSTIMSGNEERAKRLQDYIQTLQLKVEPRSESKYVELHEIVETETSIYIVVTKPRPAPPGLLAYETETSASHASWGEWIPSPGPISEETLNRRKSHPYYGDMFDAAWDRLRVDEGLGFVKQKGSQGFDAAWKTLGLDEAIRKENELSHSLMQRGSQGLEYVAQLGKNISKRISCPFSKQEEKGKHITRSAIEQEEYDKVTESVKKGITEDPRFLAWTATGEREKLSELKKSVTWRGYMKDDQGLPNEIEKWLDQEELARPANL